MLLAKTLGAGMSVGIAYGIWGACGVALTSIAGHYIFHERLSARMAFGIVLIMFGVLCIELGASH